MTLDSKVPPGPLPEKWDRYRADVKLVNPASKRKLHLIIVGTGLAGSSAAATLASLAITSKCSVSGFTTTGPQHRGPGWHQRRQELPQRRRQRRTALL